MQHKVSADLRFWPNYMHAKNIVVSYGCLLTAGSLSGRTPPKTETQTAAMPQDFILSEGKGWKMGFDKRPHNPGSFSALLGGDDWSMALSKYEYDDFVKVRCCGLMQSSSLCITCYTHSSQHLHHCLLTLTQPD